MKKDDKAPRASVNPNLKVLEPTTPLPQRGSTVPKPSCCSCGTTKNLHKDGWYGYRCDSDGCIPF